MGLLNSLTRLLPSMGTVEGAVTATSTTPAVTNLTGVEVDRNNVSVARTTGAAAGRYTVTIKDFKFPRGICRGFATSHSLANAWTACSLGVYSGNDVTIDFAIGASAVPVDQNFSFKIDAY